MIRRWWRAYRGLRLGTRLALGLGVLSLAVFAVVGTALTAYMRDYLERQLADQMKLVQVVQSKDAAAHGTKRQSTTSPAARRTCARPPRCPRTAVRSPPSRRRWPAPTRT